MKESTRTSGEGVQTPHSVSQPPSQSSRIHIGGLASRPVVLSLQMASARMPHPAPERRSPPRRPYPFGYPSRREVRWSRRALRVQDALDDTRIELAELVEPALATSSVARAVSGWLADSPWLRVGFQRTIDSNRPTPDWPSPPVDILVHLPKVILATLLLWLLRLTKCSWYGANLKQGGSHE